MYITALKNVLLEIVLTYLVV